MKTLQWGAYVAWIILWNVLELPHKAYLNLKARYRRRAYAYKEDNARSI